MTALQQFDNFMRYWLFSFLVVAGLIATLGTLEGWTRTIALFLLLQVWQQEFRLLKLERMGLKVDVVLSDAKDIEGIEATGRAKFTMEDTSP